MGCETESAHLAETSCTAPRVPTCMELGLRANHKGHYQSARQMLRTAIQQLHQEDEKDPRITDLIITIADSYLKEGDHEKAKTWYCSALRRLDTLMDADTFQTAYTLSRLAEVCVLQSDMVEFSACIDQLQRAYLLSSETDASDLFGALIDLSWTLCLTERVAFLQPVNEMLQQIKQIEEEERLNVLVA